MEFDLISTYGLTFYMIEHFPKIALIITVFMLTFIINLPFGYYRRRAKKFSFKWFLYIHLPIPVIVAARLLSNIDFRYIPLFIFAAITGQFLGGRLDI